MLTARSAFVVQVDDAAHAAGRLDGRIEHVLSGKSAAFDSAGALLAFIVEALRDPLTPQQDDDSTPKRGPRARAGEKKDRER